MCVGVCVPVVNTMDVEELASINLKVGHRLIVFRA